MKKINLSKGKKCQECEDVFYNESDINYIEETGECAYCFNDFSEEEMQERIKKNMLSSCV